MSPPDRSPSAELAWLTRVAAEARDLSTLLCAQHRLRVLMRHALDSWSWSDLDEAQDELRHSPSLAARFNESLRHVLETPELAAWEPGAHWHGQVLAIPVALASREGTLVSLPRPLASTLRESLRAQLPDGTGLRLHDRLIPQLVAHSMRARSWYELVEELVAGEDGSEADPGAPATEHYAPHGRSLGRHYLLALAFSVQRQRLALEVLGDLGQEPRLVGWATAQTEAITKDFAERNWPVAVEVSTPRQLREILSAPPVLADVREVDGLLDHAATQHGMPITLLRADLSLRRRRGEETALWITISDRRNAAPLTHCLYRLASLGTAAGAYQVAVRLASAGVELSSTDDALRQAVERAITLFNAAPTSETAARIAAPAARPPRASALLSRFSRSLRQ